MQIDKLKALVSEKNERLERETLREAENLIEQIAGEQRKIKSANQRIVEIRKELADLNVETLDSTEILEG